MFASMQDYFAYISRSNCRMGLDLSRTYQMPNLTEPGIQSSYYNKYYTCRKYTLLLSLPLQTQLMFKWQINLILVRYISSSKMLDPISYTFVN